jgi:hypothetical protein
MVALSEKSMPSSAANRRRTQPLVNHLDRGGINLHGYVDSSPTGNVDAAGTAASATAGPTTRPAGPCKRQDRVPYKFVIVGDPEAKFPRYWYFTYQLENREGQKLTGKGYSAEEHIHPAKGEINHRFVRLIRGVIGDKVGLRPKVAVPPWFTATSTSYQTWTVRYRGEDYKLTTESKHVIHVSKGRFSWSTVTVVHP